MHAPLPRPSALNFGPGCFQAPLCNGPQTPVIVGFRAQHEPESPNKGANESGGRRLGRSLLSDLLAAETCLRAPFGAPTDDMDEDEFEDGDATDGGGDDYDEDDDLGGLDADELSLLEQVSAAWSPSSSSVFSAAPSTTSCGSSRPIAIPAASYFKDQAQRMHLDRLNKKRQWYSQQQEQAMLGGKTGAKAAAQHVPRPPPKHHKQYNGHGGQQK
ncbi:MAG: hypothetical protein J3K34DRAFT_431660 [Monoraphidium minutum]|nr:MAG: hypothetical protein J3K34DRAFT_431660 [Monoraphidium minutum]